MPFPRLDDEDTPQSVVMPPTPYPTPDLNAAPATANEEPTNHGRSDSLPLMSARPAPYVQKQPDSPRGTLPGMPPSMTPDDLAPYLGQQKQSMSKFGPQEQVELENSLVNQRNGLGYKLADAGKGFADALMQGVAGAGNPGWQKQFEDQNMMQGQEQMGVLQKAHEGQLQDTQANMSLDKMSPKSVLSKTAQQTYAPLFQKLGYPVENIAGMSAANIENALTLMATYGSKEQEALIQKYRADAEIGETRRHNVEMEDLGKSSKAAEEKIAEEKNQEQALGDLSKMGVWSRLTHPSVTKGLEENARIGEKEFTPDVMAYAKKHGISSEQAFSIKQKRGG